MSDAAKNGEAVNSHISARKSDAAVSSSDAAKNGEAVTGHVAARRGDAAI